MLSLEILKNFVEGKLDASALEQHLYNNKDLEDLLSSGLDLPAYAKAEAVNLYYYLVNRNFENTEDLFNSQSIIADFLTSRGIEFHKADLFENKLAKEIKIQKKGLDCLKKKPKWLQEPDWPFDEGEPLLFVGQLDISPMRHDTSYVYVFYNKKKETYLTIEQSM
ncbi:hypothetical protein D0T84_20490 [Dysgonomonas sp. 521]|uniref:hypothetical protein n=1 Tax=Dysgonomonas sp. 521 TaxID=2302932 RepID=UPI0013D30B2A|nr:hypothetical protein [Dysgonomonas sp. 521]NDV97262.1 hypothetical protein [Dysgonomonas sp. 521]